MAAPERHPAGITGVQKAVASGDVRRSLESIRDGLALALEEAQPNEAAPLAKQLADVIVRIAALPGKESSAVDDLAAKRKARRSRSSDAPAKSGQRRAGSDGAGGKRGLGS